MRNIRYNFRVVPELVWPVLAAVGGAILTELLTTEYTAITDWRAWGWGLLGALAFRTIPAAILAALTDGFQLPGQQRENIPDDQG